MNRKERLVLVSILISVLLLIITDIASDSGEGVEFGHLLIEGSAGVAALLGIFLILKNTFSTQKNLLETHQQFNIYRKSAEEWRTEAKKYLDGLSGAIEEQLNKWGLTNAEKEVAFLLLKGLSLKEIASTRNTSEKTARAQSISIYSKAALEGRSELAAFFLEDLLLPSHIKLETI